MNIFCEDLFLKKLESKKSFLFVWICWQNYAEMTMKNWIYSVGEAGRAGLSHSLIIRSV